MHQVSVREAPLRSPKLVWEYLFFKKKEEEEEEEEEAIETSSLDSHLLFQEFDSIILIQSPFLITWFVPLIFWCTWIY
jgi:hypothetical protein